MELDPETGETRPIIEPENKPEANLPTLNKKDRKYKKKKLKKKCVSFEFYLIPRSLDF